MKTPPWFPTAFAAAMAAIGLGGYIWFRRQNQLLLGPGGDLGRAKGKLITTMADHAPMISETKVGDATLRHFRQAGMPIETRVRHIQDLVWSSINDPRMRKIALAVTRKCPERDGTCEAKAIYKVVKDRIRYTGDVGVIKHGSDGVTEGVDYFQSAWRTWDIGGGDCDDQCILLATLLALNGITPRLRITAAKRSEEWSHIYVIAGLPKLDPKKWTALDTTLPGNNNFGREVPFAKNLDFVVRDVAA